MKPKHLWLDGLRSWQTICQELSRP